MRSDPRDVASVAPADLEIGLVLVEGFRDRHWPAAISVTSPPDAGNGPSTILCLPEIENDLTVGFVEIIGGADRLGPVAALAIGGPDDPCACRRIPTITHTEPRADLREDWFFRNRELEPRGSRLQFRRSRPSRHRQTPDLVVSRKCPGDGRGLYWTGPDSFASDFRELSDITGH
jgi:hypothetical protein